MPDARRIDPVLVEKARERFDEIVGVAAGESRVFDDDRRVIGEFWDALDRQQKWFDELRLKEEHRAARYRVGQDGAQQEITPALVRLVSTWRPVEQGDADGD